MKKGIVFVDFNGVLSFNRYWSGLNEIDPEAYASIQETIFLSDKNIVGKRMRGEMSSYEIGTIIENTTGLSQKFLIDMLQKDCETIDIDRNFIDSLVHNDYHLILVTDNMDCFDQRTREKIITYGKFQEIRSSSSEGYCKADNAGFVFTSFSNQYNVSLNNCYLIDDSLKNCTLFTELGGKSINFTDKENFYSHPLWIHELSQMNG